MPSFYAVDESSCRWAQQKPIACWHEKVTTSTNDIAKQEAFVVQDETKLYVADHQTQGRGRNTNTWIDVDSGAVLLSTWRYRLTAAPQHLTGPLFGLALFNAVKNTWPTFAWSIKPPNDLYLNDKKVAGLLVEAISLGREQILLVGLGLNVFDHPGEIPQADHLSAALGRDQLKEQIWHQFLNALYTEFLQASQHCREIQLTDEEQSTLLDAVNAFPLKREKYLHMTKQGDLVGETQTTSWHDL